MNIRRPSRKPPSRRLTAPRPHIFKVEVQSDNKATQYLQYSSPRPFTAADLTSLLRLEKDSLQGLLVEANNPGTRLGLQSELDPTVTYVLLCSSMCR